MREVNEKGHLPPAWTAGIVLSGLRRDLTAPVRLTPRHTVGASSPPPLRLPLDLV